MSKKSVILIIILAVAFGIALSFYGSSISTYSDFATAKQNPNKEFHIIGTRVYKEKEFYNPKKDLFTFYLQDSLGNIAKIHYYDPKPANFDMAKKVVVIGKYKDTVFVANKILEKCPSKYKGQEKLN